jgi:hypothetical protein
MNLAVKLEKRLRIREKGIYERTTKITEEKDDSSRGSRRTHSGAEIQEETSAEVQNLWQGSLAQLLLLPLMPSSGEPPFR